MEELIQKLINENGTIWIVSLPFIHPFNIPVQDLDKINSALMQQNNNVVV